MTQQTPIEDLIRKAQAGDTDAFAQLEALYRRRIEALTASRLGPALRSKVSVDDVVQETFTRALESLDRFQWQGENSFLRWLGVIVRNVITRSARGAKVSSDIAIIERIPGSGVSPSRLAQREERFDRLEDALAQLTPEQRQAIQLSRIDGLKIREIAEKMGKTPDAVQQLIARGLRSLKRHFGDTESLHLPDRTFGTSHHPEHDEGTP